MSASASSRFGVHVGGVALLLPPELACEFVAGATVVPLPRAGRRVLGLTQLRGQPVVVLDASAHPGAHPPALRRHSVVVLGGPPDGAALVVDEAPEPVRAGATLADASPPECAFASALEGAVEDAADPSRAWWRFDPRRLFEALAGPA